MFNVFGKTYYIDVDEVIKKCRPDYGTKNFDEAPKLKPKKKTEDNKEDEGVEAVLELNVFKFEIFKACIERMLNEYEQPDEELGTFGIEKNTTPSFKVAFNTLLKYEILIEDDNE